MTSQPREPEARKAQKAKAMWAAPCSFVRAALHRLRFRRRDTAQDVEEFVRLLDSGTFDHFAAGAASQEQPATPRAYKDLKPFRYADWKERHGVKD